MGQFEITDLVYIVDTCATGRAAGRLVSMARAV